MNSMSKVMFSVIATACIAMPVFASDPLSFDFMVTGSPELRPTLVFHDGQNTYLQPSSSADSQSMSISGGKAERYGPYIMVHGIPKTLTLSAKKGLVTITYQGERDTGKSAVSQEGRGAAVSAPAEPQKPAKADVAMVRESSKKDVLAAKDENACAPRIVRDEQAFMVGFDRGGAKISSQVAERMISIVGDTSKIEKIRFSVDSSGNYQEKVRSLRAVMARAGIQEDHLQFEAKRSAILGTEMRLIRAVLIKCVQQGSIIEVPSRDRVTISANGDAADVIKQLAEAAGLLFRTEGAHAKINVQITETQQPLVLVLERIAKQMGKKADLVFRNHELVISYRQ